MHAGAHSSFGRSSQYSSPERAVPDLQAGVREIRPEALKASLDAGEQVTILDTRRPDDLEAWKLLHPNVTDVNVPFTEFVCEAPDCPSEVRANDEDEIVEYVRQHAAEKHDRDVDEERVRSRITE